MPKTTTQKDPAKVTPTKAPASAPADAAAPNQKTLIAPNSQVSVKIAWSVIAPVYEKHLKKAAAHVQTPGFRKGKVPLSMVEERIDLNHLYEHVLQEVLPDVYLAELKKTEKKPISQPEIDPKHLHKGEDWELDVYFAEQPEINVGKYQETVKKAKKLAATEIKEVTEARAKSAKEAVESTKATDPKTTAAPSTDLTQSEQDDITLKHIFRELVTTVEPAIPELLVRQEMNRELRQLGEKLAELGIPIEQFLTSRKMTAEQLRQEYGAMALSSLQVEFLLAEVAKVATLQAADEEVSAELEKITKDLAQPLTDDQRTEYRSYIFSQLTKQKVMKHLLEVV